MRKKNVIRVLAIIGIVGMVLTAILPAMGG